MLLSKCALTPKRSLVAKCALTPNRSFTEAKTAADGHCQTLCGEGFERTDCDMNQWKYICYNYNTGSGWKSYNIVTWGGTQCEKTVDNGLVQACNPVTGVISGFRKF